jgi:hypothetical protein
MSYLIKDFPIIFEEGPIARSYIQLYRILDINKKNIIYLLNNKYLLKKFSYRMQIKKNLHYPLIFLKDKKIVNLIMQFQEFFDFDKNYVFEMYNENYFYDLENFNFISTYDINSNLLIEKIKNIEENILINTSKQIFKDFSHKKNIIHIHPGYLPKVRGADGSLYSILNFNELGVSSFIISKSIDKGPIINRQSYKFQKFNFDTSNYSIKDIYRIWYSFFDPLLRTKHLEFLIKNKIEMSKSLIIDNTEVIQGKYYTFFKESELKEVFDKIFFK